MTNCAAVMILRSPAAPRSVIVALQMRSRAGETPTCTVCAGAVSPAMIGAAMVLITIAMEGLGELHLPHLRVMLLLFGGLACLAAYWLRAGYIDNPLFSPVLFKTRTFAVGILGNLFARLGSGALPFLVPLLLQVALGYSPAQAGMSMIPLAAAAMLAKSIARPLISKRLVELAHQHGADAVAHGATGKGNDQVRFELSAYALDPSIKVIAPWRLWDLTSRTKLIEFAEANQIPIAKDKRGEAPFSVDANLLHTSSEGKALENPADEAPDYVYQRTVNPEDAPNTPEDPVTGNANGPLGAYLAAHRLVPLPERTLTFVAKQGEAIGRTGYVGVAVALDQHGAPQSVTISGNAVTVFRTTIALDTPPQQDPQ